MEHPASPRDTEHHSGTCGITTGHPAPPWDTWQSYSTPDTTTTHPTLPRHTRHHHGTPMTTTAQLALPRPHGQPCSPVPAPRHWVPTLTGCDKPGAGGWPGSHGWGWWVLIAPSSSCAARAGVGPASVSGPPGSPTGAGMDVGAPRCGQTPGMCRAWGHPGDRDTMGTATGTPASAERGHGGALWAW